MASRRTGFGEDPGTRAVDITQGYRDANPRFDANFVKRNIEPYKDSGLPQKLGDFARKSDKELYDMAASAVLKFEGVKPKRGGGNPTPSPTPSPSPGPKPPKPPRKPKKKKPKRLPGTSPNPRPKPDPFA